MLKKKRQNRDLEEHGIVLKSSNLEQAPVFLVIQRRNYKFLFAVDFRGLSQLSDNTFSIKSVAQMDTFLRYLSKTMPL